MGHFSAVAPRRHHPHGQGMGNSSHQALRNTDTTFCLFQRISGNLPSSPSHNYSLVLRSNKLLTQISCLLTSSSANLYCTFCSFRVTSHLHTKPSASTRHPNSHCSSKACKEKPGATTAVPEHWQ